jgi:dolichol-phosphate mannosyltransferase
MAWVKITDVSSPSVPRRQLALAVVVPMLNERPGAERCIDRITEELMRIEVDGALVVVDDGSTDGTGPLLDRLAEARPGLRVVHHEHNRGYGTALRTGVAEAAHAGTEWVLFMDCDLTNPPEDIARFVAAMNPRVDYVKGSRYTRGGGMRGVPFKRRAISRVGNAFACRLFALPLSDVTNGFRAIRAASFLKMPLREDGFQMIMEETYWVRALGLRCAEIPTILTSRELGRSSFHYRLGVFYRYARYPVRSLADRYRKGQVRRSGQREGDST